MVLTLGLDGVFPAVVVHGMSGALSALALALLAAGTALAASWTRRLLRSSGVLPAALAVAETVGKTIAVAAVFLALVALVPATLVPAVPWVVVAAALALGWSLRDALPDLVARILMLMEDRFHVGQWIHAERFSGRIETVRLRATTLLDDRGQHTVVPNRLLLSQAIRAGEERWPEVEVSLSLPGVPAEQARSALWEAALNAPWIAPDGQPEIGQDPLDHSRWVLRLRLLDSRFRDPFEGTLPERVAQSLAAVAPLPPG